MATPVTDPELLKLLNAPDARQPVTDPEVLKQLNGEVSATDGPGALATAKDMALSLGSGAVRGVTETAMLPVTAERALHAGADWLYEAIFGRAPAKPVGPDLRAAVNNGQDAARSGLNKVLHTPTTTPGKYAGTIGEFLAPGAIPGRAVRAAPTLFRRAVEYGIDIGGNVITPALVSEGAGQMTKGTKYETPARILGAIAGNVGTAGTRAYNAPERVLRRATSDVTQEEWDRALGLQNNPTGVRLTGPEAIAQATGGASALPNLQRVVEGSLDGRAVTAPFFAARPGQVDTAVGAFLDQIARQDAAPSTLGPRAAAAAERAIATSPEGQALTDAIFGAGPRTTPLQAGEVIQPQLRQTFDRREGMRNALADEDYEAARRAEAAVPVAGLQPETTVTQPAYTHIAPQGADEGQAAAMAPKEVPAKTQIPALTSSTGGEYIQVDARPVVQFIDKLIPDARAATQDALRRARGMLFDRGGVDTSVNGLDAARGQLGDMITEAKRAGQMQTAEALLNVQSHLDEALSSVPAYASARQNFQAASAPLEPFSSPGMSRVIARDEFNKQFALPSEEVPGALMSPSEARNFMAVASPEAKTAMTNRVATSILDKATDGSGNVSVARLNTAMRDSEDLLAQFPDVADRLRAVAGAADGVEQARSGPLGQIAAAQDTTAAANAALPRNPLAGSAQEQGDAIARMAAQDGETTQALVRQNLADRYSKAATETQEGSREFTGAKFHKEVAGNPTREEILDAVLRALPNQSAAEQAPLILDVLQATGRRKPIGSATEFNRTVNADLGEGSPAARLFGLARTAGASFLVNAGDATKRVALQSNIRTLADMFTDPNSVELIQNAINRGAPVNLREAAVRSAAEAAPMLYDQRGRR